MGVLSLMVFLPVLAIENPDQFEYVYVTLMVSRVVRIILGSKILTTEIRSKEKWLDQQMFEIMGVIE